MVPASAQLTLTPAQEKEDTKSQEQAAKAEVEGPGKKISQKPFTRLNILTFFVSLFVVVFFFKEKKFLSINRLPKCSGYEAKCVSLFPGACFVKQTYKQQQRK